MPGKANLSLIERNCCQYPPGKILCCRNRSIGGFPVTALGPDTGHHLPGLETDKNQAQSLLPVKVIHGFVIKTTVSFDHLHFLGIHLQKDEQETNSGSKFCS